MIGKVPGVFVIRSDCDVSLDWGGLEVKGGKVLIDMGVRGFGGFCVFLWVFFFFLWGGWFVQLFFVFFFFFFFFFFCGERMLDVGMWIQMDRTFFLVGGEVLGNF